MTPTSFSVAGIDLQSGYFRITKTDAFSSADRDIKAVQLARENGAEAVFKRYKDRNLSAEGYIKAPDKTTAETSLDQLKSALDISALTNFDVGYRGGLRRWQVLSANVGVPRDAQDISYIPFMLSMYSPKPYAFDNTSASLLSVTHTNATDNVSVNVSGSYPAEPVFTLTVNSISPSVSSVDITIGNPTESRYLTVSGTRSAGDTITIDCFNKQLLVNGIITLPTGNFPMWAPGTGNVEISDSATTRSIAITDVYYPRWL